MADDFYVRLKFRRFSYLPPLYSVAHSNAYRAERSCNGLMIGRLGGRFRLYPEGPPRPLVDGYVIHPRDIHLLPSHQGRFKVDVKYEYDDSSPFRVSVRDVDQLNAIAESEGGFIKVFDQQRLRIPYVFRGVECWFKYRRVYLDLKDED